MGKMKFVSIIVCKKCTRRKDYLEVHGEKCKYQGKHEWIEIINPVEDNYILSGGWKFIS